MGLLGTVRSAIDGLKSIFGDPRKFEAGTTVSEPPELTAEGIPRKLMDRVRKAYADMGRIRKEHYEGVHEFVGPYSTAGEYGLGSFRSSVAGVPEKVIPVPLIRNMVQVYTHLLTSGTPQCNVETEYEELKPFADDFKAVLNRHLLEIDIGPAISGAVWSAMFSVGVVKTGLAEGDKNEGFEVEGEFYDPGKPFSQSVSLRNFVVDMQADSRNEISFIGDRYLRPRVWVEKQRKRRADRKQADGTGISNPLHGPMPPPARPSGVTEDGDNRLYDEIWVWDIYLPKQGVMCQFAEGDDDPLDVFNWDGPEGGPYTLLGFGWVDGEVLPSAPVPALRPLHELVNASTRKVQRQAGRAKEIYVAERSQGDDVETIKDASDGDVVGVTRVDAVKPIRYGGPDPALMALIPWAMAEFNKQAGNIDAIAGLGPQSETLGQDQLLRESANAQVNAMRNAVIQMVTRVLRQHAWYVWTDPIRAYSAEKPIEGTGLRLKVNIGAEVREGDFLDYNFTLQPYSMSQSTPAEQVESLRRFWMQDVMPNIQVLMQSGQMPDAAGYIKQVAAMTNVAFGDHVLLEQSIEAMTRTQPEMIPEPTQVSGARTPRAPVARDHNQQFMQALGAMAQNNQQA